MPELNGSLVAPYAISHLFHFIVEESSMTLDLKETNRTFTDHLVTPGLILFTRAV